MASGQRRRILTLPVVLDGLIVLPCYLVAVRNPFPGATLAVDITLSMREILCICLVLIAWHVSFRSVRLYSDERLRSTYEEAGTIVWATFLGTVAIAFISAIMLVEPSTLHSLLMFFVLATSLTVAGRMALRPLQRMLRGRTVKTA